MSLRASITNQGNITIIALEGKLDYESQDILRENIRALAKEGQRVILDLDKLAFVGSSGITSFIRSLYELQGQGVLPQFCNVKSEFKQIIAAYDENREMGIHESREDAVTHFFRSGRGESN